MSLFGNDNEKVVKNLEAELKRLKEDVNTLNDKNRHLETRLKEFENMHRRELEDMKRHAENMDSAYNYMFNCLFLDTKIEVTGVRKNIQDLSQELLDFVVCLCKKHSLTYWLDYGTLLGAKRHKTYIPFDDDLDISMMRKDFNKFNDVLEDEIREHGLDDVLLIKHDYFSKFSQITFTQINYVVNNKLIGALDIFPYDFIEDTSLSNELYIEEKREFRSKIESGVDRSGLEKHFMNALNLSYDKRDYMIMGVDHVFDKLLFFETGNVFPLSRISFSNKIYNCPRRSDRHLKLLYGNWKIIPKQIRYHKRINNLRSNVFVEKKYKEEIERMKKINEEYMKL